MAIKVLDKSKTEYNIKELIETIKILNKLDHPNIVKYYETYNDKHFIYLIQEYIPGKLLFKHITD